MIHKKSVFTGIIFLSTLALLLFSSCATQRQASVPSKMTVPKKETEKKRSAEPEELSPIQKKLVEGAYKLKGAKTLVVRGRTFPMDCSGSVMALYYYAGIDLSVLFSKYSGNGVARIFQTLKDLNLVYLTDMPAPGDIIFWDDTWDRNEDGKWNDKLTHMGMVVSTSKWGTVDYVHLNYRKGLVFERMNLKEPDVFQKEIDGEMVTINSPMRMRGEPEGPKWLSSHLLDALGKGYLLPANFKR